MSELAIDALIDAIESETERFVELRECEHQAREHGTREQELLARRRANTAFDNIGALVRNLRRIVDA